MKKLSIPLFFSFLQTRMRQKPKNLSRMSKSDQNNRHKKKTKILEEDETQIDLIFVTSRLLSPLCSDGAS